MMEQSASAYLYPKRIIISTRICDEYGSTWTETDCLFILPIDISDAALGVVVLRHLSLSEIPKLSIDERWDIRNRFKALGNFKTEGQVMKDSKLVFIVLGSNQLRFQPTNNKYSEVRRHYYEYKAMPKANFKLAYPIETELIGAALRKAWKASKIT